LVDSIRIAFHLHVPDIPQLTLFVRRSPKFQALNEAHVDFKAFGIGVTSFPPGFDERSGLSIDGTLSSIFTSLFPSIYMVEHLYIYGCLPLLLPWEDTGATRWLEFFDAFTTVKNLYVCGELVQSIVPALQELVGERVPDVLPALEGLFLDEIQASEPVQEAIG
jgi:hypothetical protein